MIGAQIKCKSINTTEYFSDFIHFVLTYAHQDITVLPQTPPQIPIHNNLKPISTLFWMLHSEQQMTNQHSCFYPCITTFTHDNGHEQLVIDVELKLKRPLFIVEAKMTHAQTDVDKSFPPSAPKGKNGISILTGRGTSSYFHSVPWPLPDTEPRKKTAFRANNSGPAGVLLRLALIRLLNLRGVKGYNAEGN